MEGKMKRKKPIGIQDFEKLQTEGIYRLAVQGMYYFLSRPRRFGKSLLISTIKVMFLGKLEVFKGLAIDSKPDIDWSVHPVLRLYLNSQEERASYSGAAS